MKGKWSAIRRFCAGLLMSLFAILAAVLLPAFSDTLFEDALIKHVDAGLSGDTEQLHRFADETIGYISGRLTEWSPTIVAADGDIVISKAFSAHMAEVRHGMQIARFTVLGCMFGGLALLGWAWAGLKPLPKKPSAPNGRIAWAPHRLANRAYYLGAALPLVLTLALCLWAALDFGSFWSWLHRAFIPGGIFAANEPVMRLFPLALFGTYLAPVAMTLLFYLFIACMLPILLENVGRKNRGSL